jgi:hypothetical protein
MKPNTTPITMKKIDSTPITPVQSIEDENAWTHLVATFEADLAWINAQIKHEAHTMQDNLAALREQRDTKRNELDQQIQARTDRLNAAISQSRTSLGNSANDTKASIVAQLNGLEASRKATAKQLETSWHTQRAEWQRDLDALQRWSSKANDAAKASIDAQISSIEAKRQARQEEWDQRKHAMASAAQDLKAGAQAARTDLEAAREKAVSKLN